MKRFFFALLLVSAPLFSFAQQQLSKEEKKLIERIDKNYQETVQLLEEVVNINSGSLNLAGVREVGRVFEREFQKIGFQTEWVDVPAEVKRAGHFVATRKGSKGKKLFLIGHLDTVFEKDMPFTPFTWLNDSTATGQGANDMKGGDVLVLASLKAMHELGLLEDRTITVYFNEMRKAQEMPPWHARTLSNEPSNTTLPWRMRRLRVLAEPPWRAVAPLAGH